MTERKSIAIIGAGISGLATAFNLDSDFEVTIFEQEDYLGGHTDTHELTIDGQAMRIDSGFIVFCRRYYPHFSALLDELEVASQVTEMSFSARNHQTGVIYNATSLNKLFCQRRNLVSPNFYKMLWDMVRFYRRAPAVLASQDETQTVAEYLHQNNYGESFSRDHLFPMISALWSATPQRVAEFPIRHLVEFLYNHGMMKLVNRPEWRVIKNGSNSYVTALRKRLRCDWQLASPVTRVASTSTGVEITTKGSAKFEFDAVVIATHSDQALSLIDKPSDEETSVLGAITYEKNHVVVHTDESVMHENRLSWASWNTVVPHSLDPITQQCCTANYWMNRLQNLPVSTNVFTTLNSCHHIDPAKILLERHYAHPVFTADSVSAQKSLSLINGKNQRYYVGAYWGWGFHEDGARSAYQTSELLKADLL